MATLKEQREKIIKARQERLARDAKKQGITPEQLLKKRRDTYLTVASPLIGLLPFGAIARGATSLFKAAKAVKKGKDVNKALKTSKTKKTPSTTTTKKVDTKKTPTKTTKKVDTKKTPTKQTKKVDKKKTTKKTDTKKKVSGSTIPKVIGAGGTAALLTTIIAKKKDGSAKAGAMPKSRPKSIKPTDFGMGMVDDFSKSKVRRTDNMEGGTAPIKPKKKKSDVSQGSTMAKTPKKAKPITAGSNVGFGPKGNIFPKDATDRKRLMNKYGGTGSAAAKAAAQGKQGSLKKVGRT